MGLENYRMNKTALCYLMPKKNKENEEVRKIDYAQNIKKLVADLDSKIEKQEILWLSSPFDIEAYFCDEHDNNYGRLLVWETIKTKQRHKWYMPACLLGGDGREIFDKFLSEGIEINSPIIILSIHSARRNYKSEYYKI